MESKKARGLVFMATSIDGFVARKDHSLDWLMKYPDDGNDKSYEEFIANIDVLVMGSGSFKTVLKFDPWPYTIPVLVMSHSLSQKDIPEALIGKVEVTRLDPIQLMESLFKQGNKNAYVDGGKLVQSFISDGLIEEMTITQIPILIGEGIRLFGDIKEDIDLELLNSRAYGAGFVQNHYRLKTTVRKV